MYLHLTKQSFILSAFRTTPLPLTAIVLLLSLFFATPSFARITQTECDAHLNELLSEIEGNRITTIAEINKQLADDNNPTDPQGLEIMREQAWDQEEQQRGQAHYIWRDCMKAIR